MYILSLMKTTRKAPRNVNIVKLSRGTDWVQFETSKGRATAWMTTSEGVEAAVSLDSARERMMHLTVDGWRAAA
jgi:hypothetical protein